MKKPDIFGMDNALLEAKSRPPYNMTISSKLVVEMADKIKLLTAECDELSSRLYDVQWFFCDEDGTPIIENLTIANLEKWLAKRDLEREAIGVNKYLTELARVFNHSEKSPTQVFGRRYSKELTKQAEDLTNE